MKSLRHNITWVLISSPPNKKVVDCKWIFRVKEDLSSSKPIRFKASLVAKGFTQIECLDYNEICSPIVMYTTIKLILSLVVNFD